MAVRKATTTDDLTASDEPVLAGPVAEGPTPTVPVGDPVPDSANLTDDGPRDPDDKAVSLGVSPWGSKITVSSDIVDRFTELGYKKH